MTKSQGVTVLSLEAHDALTVGQYDLMLHDLMFLDDPSDDSDRVTPPAISKIDLAPTITAVGACVSLVGMSLVLWYMRAVSRIAARSLLEKNLSTFPKVASGVACLQENGKASETKIQFHDDETSR